MPGAAPQQNQSDNSATILWVIAAMLIFGYLIWHLYKQHLIKFYFTLKMWEINFLSYFTNGLDDVKTTIITTDPMKFTFHDVVNVGNAVGEYLRIPIVILLFILAFAIYFTNSTRLFKRIYTMKDLAELEKDNWPQIVPVLGLDLVKKDIDKGPWAMALTPMLFCKRFKLLDEHKTQPKEGMTRKEWSRIEVTLRRGPANKIFALQLGALWQGIDKLPPHAKALFAIFAARYNADAKDSQELLRRISASSAKKLDFSGVDALCKKHENTKQIQQIIHSHGYVLTVMASMLVAAREDGVQASSDFLWLKPVDRKLWYMLNTVGRQTPFVEVAGPFAHWLAEKQIGRRLLVPMIEEATNALERSLKEIIYHPDEVE